MFLEMSIQSGHAFLDKLIENLHIYSYSDHLCVIVDRQYGFHEVGENPKGRFFVPTVPKHARHYEIHTLHISDDWIPTGKGLKNISHELEYFRFLVNGVLLVSKGAPEI